MRQTFGLLILLSAFATSCANCARQPAVPTLLKEGEACENDDRCETGLCDAAPGFSPVCVRKCSNDCFTTEVCVQLTPNRFSCQPDQRKLCQPCAADVDCPYPSDKCLAVNGEKVCGRDCAFDQYCPTGYRCLNAQGIDGLPKVQQCIPINASCACLARGDFQQACETTNELGTCSGTKQCDLVSNAVVCDAHAPVAETCNGIDDDCDGTIDEGQMPSTCGVGACARTSDTCIDGGIASCVPGLPTTEVCNSLDDDCDGTVDNTFDTMTSVQNCGSCGNTCALSNASPVCTGGTCRVGTCNTGFDNCNHLDPDGCEINLTNDAANCGACGNACTRPGSTPSCVNSTCNFVCAPGYVDLNMDPVDGCEYACTFTSNTDIPDLDFTDANCDGIDGEINNGLFVTPTGDDANVGTRQAPMKTIAAALSSLTTTGKRDIYLAKGTYPGPLLITLSDINIAGAYEPTHWKRALLTNQVKIVGGNPALFVEGADNVLLQAIRFEGSDGTLAVPSAYGAAVRSADAVRLESVIIRAGDAVAGVDGAAGTSGIPGEPGADGVRGCVQDTRSSNTCGIVYNFVKDTGCEGNRPYGGTGGLSACGFPGGAGGQPSKQVALDSDIEDLADNGDNGLAAPLGSGAAGIGVAGSPAPKTTPAGRPQFGENGIVGSNGNNGTGSAAGAFTLTGFAPGAGTQGTDGAPGRGGGGGGGGVGGWVPMFGAFGPKCQGYGSAGGGGGGGGCGGTGGRGGTGGGASIGLYLVDSKVTATKSSILSGKGGAGGAGGAAGLAGAGASGGDSDEPHNQSNATSGGKGGRGGNGGTGGAGGGGAGGASIGVVKNAASSWTEISTSITFGNAGAGGASPVSPGGNGISNKVTPF